MNYAIVIGGIVTNLVVWDGDATIWKPPAGAMMVELVDGQPMNIGDTYTAP